MVESVTEVVDSIVEDAVVVEDSEVEPVVEETLESGVEEVAVVVGPLIEDAVVVVKEIGPIVIEVVAS